MESLFKQISISKLARYGYPGVLVLLILYVYNIEPLNTLIAKGNWEVAIFFSFGFGTTIYIFYRYIIGELILYRFTDSIHAYLDNCNCGNYRDTSVQLFLIKVMGVKKEKTRIAYNCLRRKFFSKREMDDLDIYHTEINFLYMTSFIGIGYFWLLYFIRARLEHMVITLWLIGVLVITFWIAAIIVDINQQAFERRFLEFGKDEKGNLIKDKLKDFLGGYGL